MCLDRRIRDRINLLVRALKLGTLMNGIARDVGELGHGSFRLRNKLRSCFNPKPLLGCGMLLFNLMRQYRTSERTLRLNNSLNATKDLTDFEAKDTAM